MYVARSRQKPPENAFQMRSRMKAEQEAAEQAAKAAPSPAELADSMPDLDALREAAARAAALVHGPVAESAPEKDSGDLEALREAAAKAVAERTDVGLTSLTAVKPSEVATEPEATRGRPASSTVAERTARILELVTEAGSEGISKPDLAAAVETKEANVQVALGKLKDAGKVESRRLPDTGKYRWFLV